MTTTSQLKYARRSTDIGERPLTLNATVKDGAMYFREVHGTAALDDGTRVEVATNVGGGVLLVTVHPPTKKAGWRTYAISPAELVRAVLLAEGIDAAEAAVEPEKP